MNSRIRVIIARLGLDAHWRGSVVVARALREAGMEVVYLGNQMPEAIVQSVIQEDPDVVGLSTLSGNHMILAPMVVEGLRLNGLTDTPVVLGGTIPQEDISLLKKKGIAGVFGPGSSLKDIVDFIARCSCRETKTGQGPAAGPAYGTAKTEKEGRTR
jgi:methylmalonyl-CoA mutase C-terminal domain/subunit